MKPTVLFEFSTGAGGLFPWSTSLTFKYDFCPFDFMPLHHVTVVLIFSIFFFQIDFIELVENFKDFSQIPLES